MRNNMEPGYRETIPRKGLVINNIHMKFGPIG